MAHVFRSIAEEATMNHPLRVLFICTGNSCRSQMAEALLRELGGADFAVFSAGTEPRPIHPLTRMVMDEIGVDISGRHSKSLERYLEESFDFIITVCDKARGRCPDFPGDNSRIHWGFEDPAQTAGSQAVQLQAFRRVRNEIRDRLRPWITLQRRRLDEARAAVGG
jgi:arsenate reductase (thioredoxin)